MQAFYDDEGNEIVEGGQLHARCNNLELHSRVKYGEELQELYIEVNERIYPVSFLSKNCDSMKFIKK